MTILPATLPTVDAATASQSVPASPPIAQAIGLTRTYGSGEAAVEALRGIDIAFAGGQFSAIMGPSGSGKSTLMHCLAGLDRPTAGSVSIGGEELTRMSERELTKLRRRSIGFIFQAFNLVATLTAVENITLPLELAHKPIDQAWLAQVVEALGLGSRLRHRPSELSGGQQQRVACARAMIARPAIIFADEPTGNLDSAASRDLLKLLRRSVDQLGQSLVMVTHDAHAAAHADRVLFLGDGQVVGDLTKPDEATILEALRHHDQDSPSNQPPPHEITPARTNSTGTVA